MTLDAFLSHKPDRVVYWGTSGQRITQYHTFDCFSMVELLEHGILLWGEDIRNQLIKPSYEALRQGVQPAHWANHLQNCCRQVGSGATTLPHPRSFDKSLDCAEKSSPLSK